MSCTTAFFFVDIVNHKKNAINPQSKPKPKPVPLSVAPMPICGSCPTGVTVTRSCRGEVYFVLPWMWCPAYLACSVKSAETPTFILRVPPAHMAAASPAASSGPKQLLAWLGACRAQASTQAAFLKCLLLSVDTSGGAEGTRVSGNDSVKHWW